MIGKASVPQNHIFPTCRRSQAHLLRPAPRVLSQSWGAGVAEWWDFATLRLRAFALNGETPTNFEFNAKTPGRNGRGGNAGSLVRGLKLEI
jgi:hypothetical protein